MAEESLWRDSRLVPVCGRLLAPAAGTCTKRRSGRATSSSFDPLRPRNPLRYSRACQSRPGRVDQRSTPRRLLPFAPATTLPSGAWAEFVGLRVARCSASSIATDAFFELPPAAGAAPRSCAHTPRSSSALLRGASMGRGFDPARFGHVRRRSRDWSDSAGTPVVEGRSLLLQAYSGATALPLTTKRRHAGRDAGAATLRSVPAAHQCEPRPHYVGPPLESSEKFPRSRATSANARRAQRDLCVDRQPELPFRSNRLVSRRVLASAARQNAPRPSALTDRRKCNVRVACRARRRVAV